MRKDGVEAWEGGSGQPCLVRQGWSSTASSEQIQLDASSS